jgi:L-ascorbate metabolism protein UlaG (beta-lactamase superfamily)
MPHEEIVAAVKEAGAPDVAFLPCNERNVYRDRAGIVGNMSVREMLAFAGELQAKSVVALHWDMFRPNSVLPEEIMLVAEAEAPNMPILIPQCGCRYDMNFKRIDEPYRRSSRKEKDDGRSEQVKEGSPWAKNCL